MFFVLIKLNKKCVINSKTLSQSHVTQVSILMILELRRQNEDLCCVICHSYFPSSTRINATILQVVMMIKKKSKKIINTDTSLHDRHAHMVRIHIGVV